MVLSTRHSTRRSRSPHSLGGTAQSVYVATSDVDGLHGRAVAAGAEVSNPLRDTDHGREFCCLDPEGHIWTFGSYRPGGASADPAPNKQAASAVFEIWSSGELDRLDGLVAPDGGVR